MHIVVCLKNILDPELPPRDFQLDPVTGRVREDHAVRVTSPFDENALELALRLKEQVPGSTVTAITLGDNRAEEALRRALALKADRAVLLCDAIFGDLDSYGTAAVLAAALKKMGGVDLVLCGRQAGDWDHGQVPALLAELLDLAYVPFAFLVRSEGGRLHILREIAGGAERVEVPCPAVISVTNHEENQLRPTKTRDLLMARRQPVATWSAGDLAVADLAPRVVLTSLSLPPAEAVACEWITGDPRQQAERLLERLTALGLIGDRD